MKVSVPPAPSILSNNVNVVSVALKVSLFVVAVVPPEPTKIPEVSVPVVSVRYVRCKYLILNATIVVASINDEITT